MNRQDKIDTLHKFIIDNFDYGRWIDINENEGYDETEMTYDGADRCGECYNCEISCPCRGHCTHCPRHDEDLPCTASKIARFKIAASKFNRKILEKADDEYISYLMVLMSEIKTRSVAMMDEDTMVVSTSKGFIFTACGDLLIFHDR